MSHKISPLAKLQLQIEAEAKNQLPGFYKKNYQRKGHSPAVLERAQQIVFEIYTTLKWTRRPTPIFAAQYEQYPYRIARDFLEQAGLVHLQVQGYDASKGKRKSTIYHPTDKLLAMLNTWDGYLWMPIVLVKEQYIPHLLTDLNDYYKTVLVQGASPIVLKQNMKTKNDELYGRVHAIGSDYYQRLSDRTALTFNSEYTDDIDLKASHPSILLSQFKSFRDRYEGKIPNDIYLEVIDKCSNPHLHQANRVVIRDLLKECFMVLLWKGAEQTTNWCSVKHVAAYAKKHKTFPYLYRQYSISEMVEAYLEVFPELSQIVPGVTGRAIVAAEADMMLHITRALTKAGYPAVPTYDSLTVVKSGTDIAYQLMQHEFLKRFGMKPSLKVNRGKIPTNTPSVLPFISTVYKKGKEERVVLKGKTQMISGNRGRGQKTEVDVTQVRLLQAQGMSVVDIAKQNGWSKSAIYRELKRKPEEVKTMTTEIKMPKTRPGQIEHFNCLDCGVNTGGFENGINEYYMVKDDVWNSVSHRDAGMLCIGCLEKRLGRELTHEDFDDCGVNSNEWEKSDRLKNRLTKQEQKPLKNNEPQRVRIVRNGVVYTFDLNNPVEYEQYANIQFG